ncbi:MAG: TetR/AcrR family transcriptional regulator [Alphaproteobacteria bacterium]
MRKKDIKNTEKRENEILKSATKCFAERGFHQTSMRDIAKEAGLSLGNIYRYFENKEALIKAFIEIENQETSQAFEQLSHEKNFKKSLKVLAKYIIVELSNKHELALYLDIFSEALRNKDVMNVIKEEKTEALFSQALIDAKQKGKIKLTCSPEATTLAIMASIENTGLYIAMGTISKRQALKNINEIIDKFIED